MEESWSPLWDFPEYWISDMGSVRHVNRNYPLTTHVNTTGTVYVSLWCNNRVSNRSLALLVASTFVDRPEQTTFDTPINLNGERRDNRAINLAWRPNWFARKYRQQFSNNKRGFKVPVMLLDTGELFPNSWEAAIKYGLLDIDILVYTFNNEKVWPLGFTFRPANMKKFPFLGKPHINQHESHGL